ncbi:type II toxin-antitoxin system RelE/ParE family toxin, partial [Phocaeicola vulgatus]|nr:type II toxin-antitoxin system RelE/ParE family toxin [Phocaeicola vulgatus]
IVTFYTRCKYNAVFLHNWCKLIYNCLVILFNGFQKKTQKTPDREIDKALKLKKEYYERKRTKDV